MNNSDSIHASSINTLVNFCHSKSLAGGWWHGMDITNPLVVATRLCLIHTEVSEAVEGHRRDTMDEHLPHRKSIEVELADALIRILDLAGAMNMDLGGAVVEKLDYNIHRDDHKPENRKKQHGKRY